MLRDSVWLRYVTNQFGQISTSFLLYICMNIMNIQAMYLVIFPFIFNKKQPFIALDGCSLLQEETKLGPDTMR